MTSTQTTRPLPLGQTVTTPGYLALFGLSDSASLDDAERARRTLDCQRESWRIIDRHAHGDWGDLDTDDKRANDEERSADCGHVLSLYHVKGERVYIETCWNDEGYRTTCVMLPEER